MGALSLGLARDGEQLAAWEEAWWDLWRRTPTATPFQSPAWLIPWQRQFAPDDLCVGLALRSGRLAGLFPFYRERSPAADRLLPLGISLSDYLDVLVDPEEPEAGRALTELLSELRYREWRFEDLPPDALAAGLPRPAGHAEFVQDSSVCPVLELSGGPDLVECVPARRRRQLRRARAAAAEMGVVAIEAPSDSEPFLETLFALHETRWRSQGESGVLADASVRAFHRAALPRLAAARLARCWVLSIAGRYAGAYYGFCDRGRAHAYIGGFDPAFEAASPGAVLIGHAIATAIEEGAREFHFLRGGEPYKYAWGARDRWNRRRVWIRSDAE